MQSSADCRFSPWQPNWINDLFVFPPCTCCNTLIHTSKETRLWPAATSKCSNTLRDFVGFERLFEEIWPPMRIKIDDRAWPYPPSMLRQKRVALVATSHGVQLQIPPWTLMPLGDIWHVISIHNYHTIIIYNHMYILCINIIRFIIIWYYMISYDIILGYIISIKCWFNMCIILYHLIWYDIIN